MKKQQAPKEMKECICAEYDGKGKSTCGFPCPIHTPPKGKKDMYFGPIKECSCHCHGEYCPDCNNVCYLCNHIPPSSKVKKVKANCCYKNEDCPICPPITPPSSKERDWEEKWNRQHIEQLLGDVEDIGLQDEHIDAILNFISHERQADRRELITATLEEIEKNCYKSFNGMCMTIKQWNKLKATLLSNLFKI